MELLDGIQLTVWFYTYWKWAHYIFDGWMTIIMMTTYMTFDIESTASIYAHAHTIKSNEISTYSKWNYFFSQTIPNRFHFVVVAGKKVNIVLHFILTIWHMASILVCMYMIAILLVSLYLNVCVFCVIYFHIKMPQHCIWCWYQCMCVFTRGKIAFVNRKTYLNSEHTHTPSNWLRTKSNRMECRFQLDVHIYSNAKMTKTERITIKCVQQEYQCRQMH